MKVLPIVLDNKEEKNNDKEKNKIEKPSDFSQILKYMKRKFPSFILFLHICVSKYVFVCDYNITGGQLDYIEDETNTILFWTYFTFISLLCFVWEFFYHFKDKYKCKRKKEKLDKKKLLYSLLSSFISLVAFQSTIFYLDDNNVFDCFMEYNETIANILFFMSYGLVLGLSLIEYYCLSK